MHMHLCTHIATPPPPPLLTIKVITDRFTHDMSLIMHNSLSLVTGGDNQLERSTWDRNPDVTQGKRQQHGTSSSVSDIKDE